MRKALDVADLRERLKAAGNRGFWRSLDEIAQTDEFRAMLDREFPQGASEMRDPVTRRNFLKLMGASLALGGLTGCQFDWKQPQEKLVPYVRQPEQIVPGRALQYATTMTRGGYALGLLVTSHEGRPTKIEGNGDQPASLGATDVFAQAAILNMYDPDRSTGVMQGATASDYNAFLNTARPAFADIAALNGRGLRILTGTVTSPTLSDLIQSIIVTSNEAVWYQYEPLGYENTVAGAQLAFGQAVDTVYQFNFADVVVSLDSDFTSDPAAGVRYSRDLAEKRVATREDKTMSRLYVAEPGFSNTGTLADHRLPVKASAIAGIAGQLAAALGVPGISAVQGGDEKVVRWIAAAAADLRAAGGRSVVIAGEGQPPEVHALVHAINATLGSVGRTVTYINPVVQTAESGSAGLTQLVADINAGEVTTLLMFGVNPVYDAPAELNFAEALPKVALSVHHGLYQDETAALSTWHVPAAHFLESWGDARAFDGSVALMQPLIAPLYGGKTALEVLNGIAGGALTDYDLVAEFWRGRPEVTSFDTFFPGALNLGVVRGSAFTSTQPTLASVAAPAGAASEGLEIVFRPDPALGAESEYGNNRWLHELPKPFSKLTWDNVASVSPRTAETLGLASGDVVTLTLDGRTINAPAHIQPGTADDVVIVTFGYGRTRVGQAGNNVGYNAFALRTAANRWFAGGLSVTKTGETHALATTQGHFSLDLGRDKYVHAHGTLKDFVEDEEFVHKEKHKIISLFPEYKYNGYKWGMSINSTICNGCNACVIACQAENNIPVVGKTEIIAGREMHWLRIDQYYEGEIDDPTVLSMVMLCQQCENAPCEIVCPVAATVHDNEGLNNMVYNRCVGTKYCSNNCPYKVRRFNFYQYGDQTTPSLKLQRNPEVTVRIRGVMEKCTFCVQRITTSRIDAERENRTLVDGEVQTACQQVCPTQAIVFGDLNNPNARVVALKEEPLTFVPLDVLNTAPRVTYMAKMTNPNPELDDHSSHSA